MNHSDDLDIYLPKYLSSDSVKSLIDEIKMFPENIDSRLYINSNSFTDILQGDGLNELLIYNLPNPEQKIGSGIIISNSCDISPDNEKVYNSRVMYAPITSVSKYKALLEEDGIDKERINGHLHSAKKQHITQFFYLPQGNGLEEDHIAFLDFIISLPQDYFVDKSAFTKRFTLSNYGFYLLLFKLSIHFSRIQEKVSR
ncbi:hypothetical protein [Leptospira bandrabouensis]|uniref:Uncharacterized protein n=1 Tax=Leptospira bandrabouensis TaxID=2484903 RepID=A0A6H3NJR3_9LEPT|nr:hypothetical protein [Leptospira bandrabouensis]MCG6154091.1 hypothetical protein [Leptospira bandrabouensis]TGN09440.1 hypothetical protein EHR07_01385 [Leptospira bandrabouensis]TGN11585.1 hypothetical protein EHR08_17220 [Leptospira bandrabouensis]